MKEMVAIAALAVLWVVAPQAAPPPSSRIAPIATWNEIALETAHQESLDTQVAAQLYTMVNAAIYDAVNGIDVARGQSNRDFARVDPEAAPTQASRNAAASAAAHAVLSELFPRRAVIFDAQLEMDLNGRTSALVTAGVAWGKSVGQSIATIRPNDGASLAEIQPGGNSGIRSGFHSAPFRNIAPFESNAPFRNPVHRR